MLQRFDSATNLNPIRLTDYRSEATYANFQFVKTDLTLLILTIMINKR